VDFSGCIRFAAENPVTCIETVEGDQPPVFYYHTRKPKSVGQQLRTNPKAEVGFHAPDAQGAGRMVRVARTLSFWKTSILKSSF